MRKKNKGGTNKSLAIIRQYFPKVTKLVDANAPAFVEVTPEDSIKGKPKNPALCVFARACYRDLGATGVIVGATRTYVVVKHTSAVRYTHPISLQKEIAILDRGSKFAPGLYQISPCNPSARLGTYHGGGTHKARGTGKSRFRHYTTGIRVLSHAEEVRS